MSIVRILVFWDAMLRQAAEEQSLHILLRLTLKMKLTTKLEASGTNRLPVKRSIPKDTEASASPL
jgi:hypothetical protein